MTCRRRRSTERGLRVVLLIAGSGLVPSPLPAQGVTPAQPAPAGPPVAYRIESVLEPHGRRLTGHAAIAWRNDFEPTSRIVFRLGLNAWRDARSSWMRTYLADRPDRPQPDPAGYGSLSVSALAWAASGGGIDLLPAARFIAPDDGNADDRTVMSVTLPREVARGERISLSVGWEATLPRMPDAIGQLGHDVLLAGWFPRLCAYGPDGWRANQAFPASESAGDVADFDVRLTVPAGWPVAATGRALAVDLNPDGTATHRLQQHAVREFAWATSPRYVERRVTLAGVPGAHRAVALQVLLHPEHAAHADRIVDAAREALARQGEWLVPYPDDHLAVVDAGWRGADAGAFPRLVTVRPRWWQAPAVLDLEAQVARGVGRQWWGELIGLDLDVDRAVADGLAEYLQSAVVARIFDRRHRQAAYSVHAGRLFGGFLTVGFDDIRLERMTDGLGRAAYRGAARPVDPSRPARAVAPSEWPAIRARAALTLGTLERYAGWPAVQRALQAAAQRFAGTTTGRAGIFGTVGETIGLDLTWLFGEALGGPNEYDYRLEDLSTARASRSACGFDPCYRSSVVVRRHGPALFTGTSRLPVGPYESGQALGITVGFADGQRAAAVWDGRAKAKTLAYEAQAPARWARLDPDRVLLADADYLDNDRTLAPASGLLARRWLASWVAWLQNLLLTQTMLF